MSRAAMSRHGRSVYAVLAAGLVVALVAATFSGCAGTPVQRTGSPWHHLDDGTFRNPPGSPDGRAAFREMAAFLWRRARADLPAVPAAHALSQDEAIAAFRASENVDSVTWLGHAAFLVRVGGKVILTDPYLSDVAGPWGVGPERFVAPGLPLDALPPIDVVLVSHNHYDHLDADTIEALPGKRDLAVVVPLGLGAFFSERGYANVHERDWYEGVDVDGIRVDVLPAIHFSSRGPFDRNRTLWCSFAIRVDGRRVYHSGDTAYGPVFREIRERAGPFDLALVAIGAYEPRSIMRTAHVTPEEALRVASDIGASRAIGMHWGTIELTDEPPFEPGERFLAAAREAGWNDGRASVMRIGETRPLPPRASEHTAGRGRTGVALQR